MAQILLFNIPAPKAAVIRALAARLDVSCREIPPDRFGRPLGALTGRPGFPGASAEAAFADEMLVMDGLGAPQFHGLLDGLRQSGAPVALKAVVTGQNLFWTPAQLARELSAEREALLLQERGRSGPARA